MTMRAGAIIVSYGSTDAAVTLATELAGAVGWSVAVVANDLVERPRTLPNEVIWLVPGRNLGYGAAYNFATRAMNVDVFALLNVDIEINVKVLTHCAQVVHDDPTIGVLSPSLTHANGERQATCGYVTRFGTTRALPSPRGTLEPYVWVTGAAMFVSRSVAARISMDGSYFLGCEDVDFCLRVAKSGSIVVCDGSVSLVHHRSQSIGGWWAYYSARNAIWFGREYAGRLGWSFQLLLGLLRLPRILTADVLKRRSLKSSRLHVLGLKHGLRPKPSRLEGPWPEEPVPFRVRT